MEPQVDKNDHFRHLLLFEFNKRSNASQAARNICAVYGEDSINERTARRWFLRFREGNFGLEDTPRTGRPSEFDEERLNSLVHENPRQTTRELAIEMECDHSTIVRHLDSLGKVQKFGTWVPHELTQANKNNRVTICASLLARHRIARQMGHGFLSHIITGDEKWCLYVNLKVRKEWVSPNKQATPRAKQGLHPKKTLLCVWWNVQGVIHSELLPKNQTITAELYCQQMRRLEMKIREKRPHQNHSVILFHDNARPHIANMTRMALDDLQWEVLPHPPYSPDIAPSDFYLFRSLSNALAGVSFENDDDLENWLQEWFESKPKVFYRKGIEQLPNRWEKIVNSSGEYITE